MIRILLPAAALLAAGACVPPPNPPAEAPSPPAEGKCDASGLGDLIGQARSEAVAQEALRRSGAKALRWIAPGQMVTMDYREDRLNLDIDAEGIVTGTRCG